MAYSYETEKDRLFTDDGQRMFLAIRDQTSKLIRTAGAARMQEIMTAANGDTWQMLACVDRLVELNEIREITADVAGQHRVFVAR